VLIAIGSARALPGRRDDLVAAASEIVAGTRRDDGCESYGFYADITDPETIVSVEIWRDKAALDAHMSHPHTQTFLGAAAELVDGIPSVVVHDVPR